MKKIDLYDQMGNSIKLLTVAEVMRILRVSRRTLYEYNDIGILPCFKFTARTIMYRQEDVENFLLVSHRSFYVMRRGMELLAKYRVPLN